MPKASAPASGSGSGVRPGRRKLQLRWLAVSLSCLGGAGCIGETRQPTEPQLESRPTDGPREGERRGRGGPHLADIIEIELTTDGAVVSRDAQGFVKLWPTLDGSDEPIPVGDRAETIDGAPRDDGWLVASVRNRGVELFSVSRPNDGVGDLRELVRRRYVVFPEPAARDLVVLSDRVLVLDEAGGLHLVDDDDDGDDTLVPLGLQRTYAGLVRTTSDRVYGLSLTHHSLGVDVQVLELVRGDTPQAWKEEPAFVLFRFDSGFVPEHLAFDATGEQLAVFDQGAGMLRVHARGDEPVKEIAVEQSPRSSDSSPRIGFVSERQIVVTDGIGVSLASHLIDLDTGEFRARVPPKVSHREIEGAATNSVIPGAHADDLRVLASGSSLAVDHPVQAHDSRRGYLGYRRFTPAGVALSPDETQIAYVTAAAIVLEQVDGRFDKRLTFPEFERLEFVRYLDAEHLLVGSVSGIWVAEIESGDVVAQARLDASSFRIRAFETDGSRARLALVNDAGGMVYAVVDRDPGGWQDPSVSLVPTGRLRGVGLSRDGVWIHSEAGISEYREADVRSGIDLGFEVESTPVVDTPLLRRSDHRVWVEDGTRVVRSRGGEEHEWDAGRLVEQLHEAPATATLDYIELLRGDLSLVALARSDFHVVWRAAWGAASRRWVAAGRSVLVVADGSGAAVINAADGAIERRRCGGEFGLFTLPPAAAAPTTGLCTEY